MINFQVKFGNTTFKTDVCPKSLNPQWNSEWFKFEVNLRRLTQDYIQLDNPSNGTFFFSCRQVDDEDLQDEPLQVTVLDHDTYSANDAIGKVYIDIDPLLCSEAASVISGWFPIYDTIHGRKMKTHFLHISCSILFGEFLNFFFVILFAGIRGEINVLVKVELFNDLNRFRQSSCGVKFFCSMSKFTLRCN